MDILAKNMVLTSPLRAKIQLLDTWMNLLCLSLATVNYTVGFHFRSYGAENVTTASIEMVVNRKWEKFQFWVTCSFKVQSYYKLNTAMSSRGRAHSSTSGSSRVLDTAGVMATALCPCLAAPPYCETPVMTAR